MRGRTAALALTRWWVRTPASFLLLAIAFTMANLPFVFDRILFVS